jgi:glutathione S-transferase
MTHPILHSFRFCPYATRARMALTAAGVTYEHREINLSQKPADFLEISPKGTVPVLLLSDGTVIDESLDIMSWAMEQNDPFGWNNLSKDEQNAMLEVVNLIDGDFAKNSYRLRNPHKVALDSIHGRKQRFSIEELYEEPCKETCEKFNNIFEGQSFLSGEKAGFTDIAIFPFLWFLSQDVSWINEETYPHLTRWLKAIESHSFFLGSMKRFNFWQGLKKAV